MAYQADDILISNYARTNTDAFTHTLNSNCTSVALQAVGGDITLYDTQPTPDTAWTIAQDRPEVIEHSGTLVGRTLTFAGSNGVTLQVRELIGCRP